MFSTLPIRGISRYLARVTAKFTILLSRENVGIQSWNARQVSNRRFGGEK